MKLEAICWLYIDCQTTGMRPSSGELLEIAWGWHDSTSDEDRVLNFRLKSRLLKPQSNSVPPRISQMTGIENAHLDSALEPLEVLAELRQDLHLLNANSKQVVSVIHHSPFEIPFLDKFFALDEASTEGAASLDSSGHSDQQDQSIERTRIPFQILDSTKIAKKLFPRLPSYNLRALAGHFDQPICELKRAGNHATATADIWLKLLKELINHRIESTDALDEWLQTKPSKTTSPVKNKLPYEYAIDKAFRLGLPRRPGIYRMNGSQGKTLYVGKATSLHARVNSYFRGQKGRDRKKLEMLTQVKCIEVTETKTSLEAALLENEEIKRLNPPYNISLKLGRRTLHFYDRTFTSQSGTQTEIHSIGPLRPYDGVDRLKTLANHWTNWANEELKLTEIPNVFFMPILPEDLLQAFTIFCQQYAFSTELFWNFRSTLAWAHGLARRLGTSLDDLETSDSEQPSGEIAIDPTNTPNTAESPEKLSIRFARLFLSAARTHQDMIEINRLRNCVVRWKDKNGEVGFIRIRNGKYASRPSIDTRENLVPSVQQSSKFDFGIADFDRLAVLRAELRKQASVKIERNNGDVVGDGILHGE